MGAKASKLSCSGRKKLGKSEPLEDLIDYDELENLFSTTNKTQGAKSGAKDKSSSILESKKAYNLSILLGHLKMPLEDIQRTILAVDDSKLTEPQIRTMLNCAPERRELRALKEYKGDPEKLGLSDKFALKMAAIPNFTERLKAMLFKAKFHERVDEVSPEIECVINGSTEVKTSEKLAKILEIVLATGNYMNRGQTRIAGASGFRISFLTKLLSTKTTDNKSTLLHVITNTILNKFPDLLDVKEELKSVGQAAKVSSQMVGSEIEELKVGMKGIRDGVKATTQKDSHSDDRYKEVMGKFMAEAEAKFARLLKNYDQMKNEFKSACDFFGEDASKITTEDFFGAFAIFLQHLETTKADLIKEKDKKEDSAKKEKDNEVTTRQRKESRGSSFTGIPPPIDQNELKRSFEVMALKKKQGLVSQKSLDDVKIQREINASENEKTTANSEPVNHCTITEIDKSKEIGDEDHCVLPSSLKSKGTSSSLLRSSSNPCNDGLLKGDESIGDRKKSNPPPPPRRSSSLTRYDLDSGENDLNICHSESLKDALINEQTQQGLKNRPGPPPVKPKPAKPARKQSLPTKFNNSSAWVVSVEKSKKERDNKQSETDALTTAKPKEEAEESSLLAIQSLSGTADVGSKQVEQTSIHETQGASLYKAIMEKFRNSSEDVRKTSFDCDGVSLYSSFLKPRLDKDEAKHVDKQAVLPQAEGSSNEGVDFKSSPLNISNDGISITGRLESRNSVAENGLKLAQTAVVNLTNQHFERVIDTKNSYSALKEQEKDSYQAIPVVSSLEAGKDSVSPTTVQHGCENLTSQSGNKYFQQSVSSLQDEYKKTESSPVQRGDDLLLQSCSALSPRDLSRERSSSSASSTSAEVSSFMNNSPQVSQPSVTLATPELKPVSILKKGPSPCGKSESHNVKFSPNERQEIEPVEILDRENSVVEGFEKGWSLRSAVNIPPPPSIPPPLPPVNDGDEFMVADSNHWIINSVALKLDPQETPIVMCPGGSSGAYSLSSDSGFEYEPRAQVEGKDEQQEPFEEAVSSLPSSQVSSPSVVSLEPPCEFSNVVERASPTDVRRKTARTHRASPPQELPPPPPIPSLPKSDLQLEEGASPFAKEAEQNACIQNTVILGSDINSLLVSVLPDEFDKGPPSFTPPPPPIDRSTKPRTVSLTNSGNCINPVSSPTSVTLQPKQSSYAKDINMTVSEPDIRLEKSRGNSMSSMSSVSSASLPSPPTDVLLVDFEFNEDDFDIGPPPSITPPPPPTQFSSYLTSR